MGAELGFPKSIHLNAVLMITLDQPAPTATFLYRVQHTESLFNHSETSATLAYTTPLIPASEKALLALQDQMVSSLKQTTDDLRKISGILLPLPLIKCLGPILLSIT